MTEHIKQPGEISQPSEVRPAPTVDEAVEDQFEVGEILLHRKMRAGISMVDTSEGRASA